MPDRWFISDTHFFHANILKFKDDNDELIRGSLFKDAEEMNEKMVENWNSRVGKQDRVYHLGDVAVGVPHQSEFTQLMHRLHGRFVLYLGNHDNIRQPAYSVFQRIELWSGGKFKDQNFVCTHIPLRKDQARVGEFNVHGHIHQNTMGQYNPKDDFLGDAFTPDPFYINVCVEHTNYKPLNMDEILAIIKDRSS